MSRYLPFFLLLAGGLPVPASADESPSARRDRLTVHGYADVYYGFNFNRPSNGDNFTVGTGTTGKRAAG